MTNSDYADVHEHGLNVLLQLSSEEREVMGMTLRIWKSVYPVGE